MKDVLMKIGNDIASLWGGSCYSFKVDAKNKKVKFYCIEHGDKFLTELTFEEIKNKYGIDVLE